MVIEDVAGRPVPAMKVFCTSIRALMNHLFLTFTERGMEIEPEAIRWVLTVPAIWSDAAKQFMRKSANLVNTIYTKLTRRGMYIIKCIK
jgi:mannitol-1-phosphate/altronate dehydrogenase